ncbi:BTB/POZ domain-containing protein [Glycine max]|nr:BTB/POZ domain-containing protein [Glycine max]
MKSSREKEKENDRCISSHMQTLHRRLLHALNLGTRHFDEKTNRWNWQCANIEVQKNVLRSIGAFLDSLSGDARAARHAIVKESVADSILGALLWILQCKSEALLSMASNVAVKLVSSIPNSLLQLHMLDLVYCLSSLLSSHQVEVATPCAIALNLVISNLSATSEKAVMEALNETETSIRIVRNIKFFAEDAKKIEYFKEMTLLLSAILWRWPPSRFSVGNDVILMKGLANIHTRTESSIKIALLKLYTSLALCDSVARKLIEDGEGFPQMVVQAMGKSNPHAVQIEGLSFVDTLEKWCRICQKDIDDHFQSEPVSRAVLMMIHSPCNTISSYARFLLLDALEVKGLSCLKSLIHTLDYTSSLESYGSFDKLQLVINLIGLTCLSSLPEYQSCIIESKGIKAIVLLVKRCLSNDIHVERRNFTPHLHTTFQERSCCCMDKEDWEGSNVLLFYSLLGLSEILRQCDLLQDNSQQYSREVTNIRAQLVSKLHEICSGNSFSPGVRWYVLYILTYFGFYGFPNELAKRIGKSLNKEEYSDMRLVVANGVSVSVHGVILAVRCPSLLPPQLLPSMKNSEKVTDKFVRETMREVQLSSHVDYEALVLLLEYVYLGCLHAGEETVKKLKILAKRCKLQHLLQMLYRQRPKWGTPFPSFNLTPSLGSAGSCFSDAILEAKSNKLVGWTCNICSDTVPHMHVHKVILQSGCDYLQGLFRSGMRESHSQVIKVDISWEALIKLVQWFYSDELPNPPSGCLWDNMDDEEKLFNLQPYVELCWLAEFWILENIQEACWDVIMSCLDSSSQLPIKIIKMAYNHSLWKLVDVAANLMAPSYRQLQNSGELEEFDDALATAGPEVRRAPSFKASKTICSGGGIHDANNLLSEIFYPVPANNYVIHQHQT